MSQLDVTQLEHAHVALLRRLIRHKKFRRYLIAQCYPIAIGRAPPWSINMPVMSGSPATSSTVITSMRTATSVRANGFEIETSLLVEKCQGYHYEHAFSYTWNAMKGYHYLMRLAHLLNALALATKRVVSQVRTLGVQAFLHWVHESCAHRWLRREWIEHFRATPWQLRLE